LFTPYERRLLETIWGKYRIPNVAARRDSVRDKFGDEYDVYYCPAHAAVIHKYKYDPGLRPEDGFVSKSGPITNHIEWILQIEQVKHWKLNGLIVDFQGDDRGGCLMHFNNDEAVGDWFDWAPNGDLIFHARFNKPYQYFDQIVMYSKER
jgi:hypothetical protein